jgi:hypothetical protein
MTQSQEKLISLDMICTDTGIASREQENASIIQRFAQIMRDGGDYPSVMCFFDGKNYKLIYGLNLLKAAEEAGEGTILVDEHPAPFSRKLNNTEKNRIVKKMLSLLDLMGEEEKENWPWREIARRCSVDERTVRNKAKELEYTLPKKIKRATKRGELHLLDTSRLGQSSKLKSKGFHWTAIDDKQFEKLVYAIVKAHHPVEIETRSGTGGQGRDLQAKFISKGCLGEHREEIYFIEAKHHQSSVSPNHILGALTWAQAEQPSALVIAVSSSLTNPCRNSQIPKWRKNNPKVRVILWEQENIEEFIKSQESTRKLALEFELISKSMFSQLSQNS